jgi:hypothetical protein
MELVIRHDSLCGCFLGPWERRRRSKVGGKSTAGLHFDHHLIYTQRPLNGASSLRWDPRFNIYYYKVSSFWKTEKNKDNISIVKIVLSKFKN